MELYIAGVLVWSFFCFTFVAEQMNPFVKPEHYARQPQWRYGRRVGASSLGIGVVFLLVEYFTQIPSITSFVICAALFTMSWMMISRHEKTTEAC